MFGIDVYQDDGTVDWGAVAAAGKTFAFVKATEGATLEDGAFSTHWPAMRDAGIVRGAYHFFRASTSSPEDQATSLLATMGPLKPGDLPPVLDIEEESLQGVPADSVVSSIQTWVAIVEAALLEQTGKQLRVIIYTNGDTWEQLGNPAAFAANPLWIANPGGDSPSVPPPWSPSDWLFWQYAFDAEVPGVTGTADLNRSNQIGKGARGSLVRDIQQRLTNLGNSAFDPGGVDGDFGDQTEAAVRGFQAANGLLVDGTVGLLTWSALLWS